MGNSTGTRFASSELLSIQLSGDIPQAKRESIRASLVFMYQTKLLRNYLLLILFHENSQIKGEHSFCEIQIWLISVKFFLKSFFWIVTFKKRDLPFANKSRGYVMNFSDTGPASGTSMGVTIAFQEEHVKSRILPHTCKWKLPKKHSGVFGKKTVQSGDHITWEFYWTEKLEATFKGSYVFYVSFSPVPATE